MDNDVIAVEVAYATAERQKIVAMQLDANATLADAISRSGILNAFPDIDLSRHKVGVFGRVGSLTQTLQDGDRVEIYRPLQQHPMDARRRRASAFR